MSVEQRTTATRARIRAGALAALALTVGTLLNPAAADTPLTFSGGPDGGTFQVFANGIADLLERRGSDPRVVAMASAGSLENLRRVERREADLGIVYGADLHDALQGRLPDDRTPYANVRTVASLYQAPVHLLVRADSDINTPARLAGRPVAVGPTGSGAAASARRILGSLGLWERIEPRFTGYSQGARALIAGEVAALWVLAAAPNPAVLHAAAETPVRLLPLGDDLAGPRLVGGYPGYTPAIIPAGTYPGVNQDIPTIADIALWVAGGQVPAQLLRNVLAAVYGDEGRHELRALHQVALALDRHHAPEQITTPLHEGATRFWTDRGKVLTTAQQAGSGG